MDVQFVNIISDDGLVNTQAIGDYKIEEKKEEVKKPDPVPKQPRNIQ